MRIQFIILVDVLLCSNDKPDWDLLSLLLRIIVCSKEVRLLALNLTVRALNCLL
jgi:hypothetical protein